MPRSATVYEGRGYRLLQRYYISLHRLHAKGWHIYPDGRTWCAVAVHRHVAARPELVRKQIAQRVRHLRRLRRAA